jgi:hypothetical protein
MKETFRRLNASFPLHVAPDLLLDDFTGIERALVDKSGVFPCQYHSIMVSVCSYITWGMNNRPIGG